MKTQIKPDLTLSMDDKIYLAVSKNITDKLSFVYTLACLKQTGNTYDGIATREAHAFKDKDAANIYHDTIEQIVGINASDPTQEQMFALNEGLIQRFNENVR